MIRRVAAPPGETMRTQHHASADDIDISSLWSVITKNSRKIAGISAAMGLGTFGILLMIPSKYTSEAKIEISGPGTIDMLATPTSGPNSSPMDSTTKVDKEAIASQVQVLQSQNLGKKLAAEMKLNARPEFNSEMRQGIANSILRLAGLAGPREGETEDERVLYAYNKALRVFAVKDSRVLTIEFQSTESDLSANAANRLAALYQDELRNRHYIPTEQTEKRLQDQISKLEREAAEADSQVERFRKEADIYQGTSGNSTGTSRNGLDEQRLTELTTEVTKAQSARSEAESRARNARELMQRGSADAIPEVQKSPVIQALIAQRTRAEREKAEADTTLLAGHPRMKQLNATVADLRRQVAKEAATIVDGLEREAKGLALREELAAKSVAAMKAQVGGKSVDNVKLASLVGQAKAKRTELEMQQKKFEEVKNFKTSGTAPIEARVISDARPSTDPSSPKRAMLSLLASAAGLIFGFAWVILKELFTSSRRGGPMQQSHPVMAEPTFHAAPQQAAQAVAAAPAAARLRVPASSAVRSTAAPIEASAPSAPSASVDAIANRLAGNAQGQGGYRTVITGAAANIVAHEEALDLTGALAAAGKQVVLVDWSTDGRGFSEGLGLDVTPGLMDLLGGRASFEDVIRRLPDSDVHVIPCGTPNAAAKSAAADRINLVLDALDEAYDHVVVTGEHSVIRDLFLAIQGRFDAGVVVADPRYPAATGDTGNGIFLGFQVTDIDVLRIDRGDVGAAARRKMQLARSGPEARV